MIPIGSFVGGNLLPLAVIDPIISSRQRHRIPARQNKTHVCSIQTAVNSCAVKASSCVRFGYHKTNHAESFRSCIGISGLSQSRRRMKTPITRVEVTDLIPLLNGRESLSFFITRRPREIRSVWTYARDFGLIHRFFDGFFTIQGMQRRFHDMIMVRGMIWKDCVRLWNPHLEAVIYLVDVTAICKSHTKGEFQAPRPSSIVELERLIAIAMHEGRRFTIDSSHRAPSAGALEGLILDKHGHW